MYVPSSELGLFHPISSKRLCPPPPGTKGGWVHSPACEGREVPVPTTGEKAQPSAFSVGGMKKSPTFCQCPSRALVPIKMRMHANFIVPIINTELNVFTLFFTLPFNTRRINKTSLCLQNVLHVKGTVGDYIRYMQY